ncbi:MAG: hypothetical protein V7678_05550 [Brevundimonas sp.]
MDRIEHLLPDDVVSAASQRGGEYAWRPSDIPRVIEAGRKAGLASLGGQLQFRTPDGTCECYWVDVDTSSVVSQSLSWSDRVNLSAEVALNSFEHLAEAYDFTSEGRSSFRHLQDFEAAGGDLQAVLWFVWYLEPEPSATDEDLL